MPVGLQVTTAGGRKVGARPGAFESGSKGRDHAETRMLAAPAFDSLDIEATINAWPCDNCYQTLRDRSFGRSIILTIEGDHGGYAIGHLGQNKPVPALQKMTFSEGDVTFDPPLESVIHRHSRKPSPPTKASKIKKESKERKAK